MIFRVSLSISLTISTLFYTARKRYSNNVFIRMRDVPCMYYSCIFLPYVLTILGERSRINYLILLYLFVDYYDIFRWLWFITMHIFRKLKCIHCYNILLQWPFFVSRGIAIILTDGIENWWWGQPGNRWLPIT